MNEVDDLGIGLPILLHIQRFVPIRCRRQLWNEALLARPVGILGARRRCDQRNSQHSKT
jgi:hypothetical protein